MEGKKMEKTKEKKNENKKKKEREGYQNLAKFCEMMGFLFGA